MNKEQENLQKEIENLIRALGTMTTGMVRRYAKNNNLDQKFVLKQIGDRLIEESEKEK